MVGQKQRIIKRFEKEAEKKNQKLKKIGLTCICGKCDLATFTLQEAKDIIILKDEVYIESKEALKRLRMRN